MCVAKIQVGDTLHRAVDTAIQLLGARGYSKDTPLEWMYRYAPQNKPGCVDGASELHRCWWRAVCSSTRRASSRGPEP